MTLLQLIALILLIVSFVFAIINPSNLQSPLLWAVWAGVILLVLGGIGALTQRVF